MLTKAEFDWIVSKVDPLAESVSAVQMEGGISSLIYKVALKTSGKIKYVIVRMIDDKQWLKEEKDLICHEAASLNHVGKIGNIPTPRWIASDVRGKHCRYPALLMGMLPGTVVLQSDNQPMWLEKMAKTLHAIHQIPANDFSWKYYAYHPLSNLRIPNWTKVPDAWRAAFAYMKQGTPAYEPVFLHRDFHPNNVLWEGENVSGVVDWVNACVGPAGIDLGHCRYNLAMLYGVSAAELF
ncbi:aminoglycoside phosphotransferase family protein [Virgibacillus sp. 179-BFC.A HS]|uniref:Aminoglycoside phosphotransferase family protein n=1 Tax=Tigheibacillus jepli TaxID=3035914 RepID=A0ABU5CMG8_9BACI|nr:aminoglycoside phosphotransferase family protein [Virgibacillus sp. 179-BFC.A HS]MDY0407022.1 aminoglycoside phosphotransferase family protein [Virgibacillus sp. 179-BFC.A HS]